ncbi:uncharacterized protein ASCRUDRAFT_43480 [Ascoidea rubescens DSM 1968]|uniref:Uncharacterized protein n=1 Tax=Ascoidea rubescens DSM 1968 TaxID=1344418 RepID=A0A1D2VNG5_9ASCO|nr:hypothetical protein ASCRUDRAFT_43480 [Ascoidea rubescens DSM 1968]ODV63095.1 hypothetical protein ASCRUDRAFT_43480 [Ascoidea rubescens DSM 1968]
MLDYLKQTNDDIITKYQNLINYENERLEFCDFSYILSDNFDKSKNRYDVCVLSTFISYFSLLITNDIIIL